MYLFNTVRSTLATLASCVCLGIVFHLIVANDAHANDYTVCNQHGIRHHFDGSMISIGKSGDVIINHNGATVNGKWAYSHTPGYVTVFANGHSHDFPVACPWGTSRF